jgi:hypothetical protein
VLHHLETLPPSALFGQLLAVAVAQALALLRASAGAGLGPAGEVAEKFEAMAARVLAPGGGEAASELSNEQLELLLAEFNFIEQVGGGWGPGGHEGGHQRLRSCWVFRGCGRGSGRHQLQFRR